MTEFMERELMKYMKSSMKAMTAMKSKNVQDKKNHNYCKNTKLKYWARNCNNVSKKTLAKKNKTISDGGITVDFWFIKVHTSN